MNCSLDTVKELHHKPFSSSQILPFLTKCPRLHRVVHLIVCTSSATKSTRNLICFFYSESALHTRNESQTLSNNVTPAYALKRRSTSTTCNVFLPNTPSKSSTSCSVCNYPEKRFHGIFFKYCHHPQWKISFSSL